MVKCFTAVEVSAGHYATFVRVDGLAARVLARFGPARAREARRLSHLVPGSGEALRKQSERSEALSRRLGSRRPA